MTDTWSILQGVSSGNDAWERLNSITLGNNSNISVIGIEVSQELSNTDIVINIDNLSDIIIENDMEP
jgi:hypothetical protein